MDESQYKRTVLEIPLGLIIINMHIHIHKESMKCALFQREYGTFFVSVYSQRLYRKEIDSS